MFAPACSTQTMGCTSVDNSDPNTTKRRSHKLLLTDLAETGGSEWLRSVSSDLALTDDADSHIHLGDGDHDLSLDSAASGYLEFTRDVEHDLDVTQGVTLAGQLGGGGGGASVTSEAIFDSNTSAGEVIYVSGDGHVDLAQANSEPQTLAVGIAIADVLAGEVGEYITVGPVTVDTWTLTPGTVYYLDPDVPGGMTSTYPTTIGDFVVILGAAATPTQLNLEIHWANFIEA